MVTWPPRQPPAARAATLTVWPLVALGTRIQSGDVRDGCRGGEPQPDPAVGERGGQRHEPLPAQDHSGVQPPQHERHQAAERGGDQRLAHRHGLEAPAQLAHDQPAWYTPRGPAERGEQRARRRPSRRWRRGSRAVCPWLRARRGSPPSGPARSPMPPPRRGPARGSTRRASPRGRRLAGAPPRALPPPPATPAAPCRRPRGAPPARSPPRCRIPGSQAGATPSPRTWRRLQAPGLGPATIRRLIERATTKNSTHAANGSSSTKVATCSGATTVRPRLIRNQVVLNTVAPGDPGTA